MYMFENEAVMHQLKAVHDIATVYTMYYVLLSSVFFFKLCLFRDSILYCRRGLVCRRKSLGSYPRSVIQNEIWKIFLRRLPLSRLMAKTLRVNKAAMKKILKNLSFGVDVKLQVSPLLYKINTHNISGVRN